MAAHRFGVAAIGGEMAAIARECGLSDAESGDVHLAVSEAADRVVSSGGANLMVVTAHTSASELAVVVSAEDQDATPRPDGQAPRVGEGMHVRLVFSLTDGPLPAHP